MMMTLIPWLAGGGIVLALMGLFVTLLARSMDASRAKTDAAEDKKADQEADEDEEKEGEAKGEGHAGFGALKILGVIKAPAIALAVIGGGVAFIGNLFDNDSDPADLVPVEIAAGELHGTLLSAGERKPVVLIVPGSGPTDRDGNNSLGVKANSYKLLAEGLAGKGITSVRVDKRGMFASAAAGDPNAVTVDAYAQDYRAWIDAIRERTGRRCIWLLGHSEGALLASAAAEGRKDVCGLILIAGAGRRIGDVLREQFQSNPANAPLLDQAMQAIAELEAGRHVDVTGMHPALVPVFAPDVQDYLISWMAVDPVDMVRRAKVKTLIVHGTSDLQITKADANRLNMAPRTKLQTLKGMNHILKEAPADRAANLATYANSNLPLHRKLAGEIEEFIEDD